MSHIAQNLEKKLFSDNISYYYMWYVPWNSVLFLYQSTPLHIAAREGYDSTVEYLAEKKADINIKDDYGVCEAILLTVP